MFLGFLIVWKGLTPERMLPLGYINKLPDFVTKNSCSGQKEFLSSSVITVGGEGSDKRGVDTCLETDSWNKNHLLCEFIISIIYSLIYSKQFYKINTKFIIIAFIYKISIFYLFISPNFKMTTSFQLNSQMEKFHSNDKKFALICYFFPFLNDFVT